MIIKLTTQKTNRKAVTKRICYFCYSKNIGTYRNLQNQKIYYCRNCAINNRKTNSNMYITLKLSNIKDKYNKVSTIPFTNYQLTLIRLTVFNYNQKQDTIIKAVCGSGKTHILLNIIAALNNGKRKIIYVSPRKNLTEDIYLNFEKNNKNISQLITTNDFSKDTKLINFSTTHQLINYYKEFDVILVDEFDAFPFMGDKKLELYLLRSLKDSGKLIMLSATTTNFKRIMKHRKYNVFTLHSRYHNLPLPIPQKIKNSHPTKLNLIIEKLLIKGSVLIFVPTKKYKTKLAKILKYKFEFISSETGENHLTIKNFFNKKIPILVSTVLLERGFNLGNLSVIIIEPESTIFNYQSLIQMAGRVNRNFDNQEGEIIFFYRENSFKMNRVIYSLKKENIFNYYAKMFVL